MWISCNLRYLLINFWEFKCFCVCANWEKGLTFCSWEFGSGSQCNPLTVYIGYNRMDTCWGNVMDSIYVELLPWPKCMILPPHWVNPLVLNIIIAKGDLKSVGYFNKLNQVNVSVCMYMVSTIPSGLFFTIKWSRKTVGKVIISDSICQIRFLL